MKRLGFIVQLFMLAACLVPFTSTRQAGALLALAPTVPVQNAPAPQEDDSERVEQAGRDKDRASRLRLDACAGSIRVPQAIPPIHRQNSQATARAGYVTVDHFHNGLGSPYRC